MPQGNLGDSDITAPHIYFNAASLTHNVSGIPPMELPSASMILSFEPYQIDKLFQFEDGFDILKLHSYQV